MNRRWQSVRERLREGVSLPRQSAVWDRVVESRARGVAAILPARDPRVRIGVLLTLLAAGAIALGVIQMRPAATSMVAAAAPGGMDGWSWLVAPVHAQAAPSSLPAIDPLDLARLKEGRWAYSRKIGVDDIVTSPVRYDTLRVIRDSTTRTERLVIVRTELQGRAVDSLIIIGGDIRAFRMVTWIRNQRDTTRFARIETTVRPDTIFFDVYPANGGPSRIHAVPASHSVAAEMLLRFLLPAITLNDRYVRSLNVLDLLGGETRAAGRPYEMRVVGREMVRTPAGSFDCWVVELKTRDSGSNRALTHLLKVARESGTLVQARMDDWNGFFSEYGLVAVEK